MLDEKLKDICYFFFFEVLMIPISSRYHSNDLRELKTAFLLKVH